MSEEKVEKGFSSGLEAYSVSEQAAKAGPRRQIKTKEIPAPPVTSTEGSR